MLVQVVLAGITPLTVQLTPPFVLREFAFVPLAIAIHVPFPYSTSTHVALGKLVVAPVAHVKPPSLEYAFTWPPLATATITSWLGVAVPDPVPAPVATKVCPTALLLAPHSVQLVLLLSKIV